MTETVQWEYRSISLGGVFSLPKDEEVEAALNELGSQGWEVVGVVPFASSYKIRILLKRPLTSTTRRQRNWPV